MKILYWQINILYLLLPVFSGLPSKSEKSALCEIKKDFLHNHLLKWGWSINSFCESNDLVKCPHPLRLAMLCIPEFSTKAELWDSLSVPSGVENVAFHNTFSKECLGKVKNMTYKGNGRFILIVVILQLFDEIWVLMLGLFKISIMKKHTMFLSGMLPATNFLLNDLIQHSFVYNSSLKSRTSTTPSINALQYLISQFS